MLGHHHVVKSNDPPDWIRKYQWGLFWAAVSSSTLEGLIAVFWAGSSAALADANDAYVHSFWYGSPLILPGLIRFFRRFFRISGEVEKYSRSLTNLFSGCFFLGSLLWTEIGAIKKLLHYAPVASSFYMLLGGLIGLAGGVICLTLLKKIKLRLAKEDSEYRKQYEYFWQHGLLDVGISVMVVLVATGLIIAPLLGVAPSNMWLIHGIDPVFTIPAVVYVGVTGIKIFRTK